MKKFVFASLIAMASISLVNAPTLRAQDSDQITIKDPAEFNSYQNATTQTDPKAKSLALESFLQTYPQSVVKKAVLDQLVEAYKDHTDFDKVLGATTRLLQLDPNNTKAIFYSVFIKNGQCAKTGDIQTCDDAAALAHKGLLAPKTAGASDADWKAETAAAYPIYHSAIALDAAIAKKDFKAAQAEYRIELTLYTDAQSQTPTALSDTYQLARAYVQPGAGQDLVQAVWFYSRVWNFAPAGFKGQIEKELEYAYKKYHGALDGLDAIKAQAASSVFPAGTIAIAPAKTPAEQIHDLLASTPDLNTLALADKETVLAIGSKEDADKLWALLKDKVSPVPGVVIEASTTVIKVAVTDDAKTAKTPDFIVNLKKPLLDKEVPEVGSKIGAASKGEAELVGTYDAYSQIPATATQAQSAQIVLRDGEFTPGKKVAPAHKPTPAHHAAH